MRPVRITYKEALHFITCRGRKGKEIFAVNKNKLKLLELLEQNAPRYRVRIFAYCIMDNEFHLIVENTGGKMPALLKLVNGQYGMFYRKGTGDKGAVYRDRYRSTLIQDESYLKLAIGYVLLIPVRKGIVETADEYLWSSISDYFVKKKSRPGDFPDSPFVNKLFGHKKHFRQYLRSEVVEELPLVKSEYGPVLGNTSFLEGAFVKNKERITAYKAQKSVSPKVDDTHFESVEKIIQEFEREHETKIGAINTGTYKGKRLRGQLLIHLKERVCLTYPEISRIPLFRDLKIGSLGRLYKAAKERMEKE
jgi:REP element-mobilizing transposase RayT